MDLTFNLLHPVFAAECSNVDISKPLSPEIAAEIEAGMDRYAVLIFRRDTPLTTEEHIRFTESLGDLEPPYMKLEAKGGTRLDTAVLSDISNLAPGDAIYDRDDRKRLNALGNQLWHSDSSYKAIPAKYSALCAHVIPPTGGETEFADMRVAWDMLDPQMKEAVKGLVAEHSRIFSKGAIGVPFTEEELRIFAPVQQPLVTTNPRTGRHALFLSSHAGRIVGWPVAEGIILLRELAEHATQREFVYRHKWRVGDLVMWDNRATMHRGRPYEDRKYPRDLRRTTLTNGVRAVAMINAEHVRDALGREQVEPLPSAAAAITKATLASSPAPY
jgi:alpha-ketoglutarate-dependent 2,4-dichlorophenoxyacetate dioxygenase